MQDVLARYLSEVYPEKKGIQVTNVTPIEGGWETDIFAFDMDYQQDGRPWHAALILRLYPSPKSAAAAVHEYRIMSALEEAHFPVPGVWHLGIHDSPFEGRPFLIMERIRGESLSAAYRREGSDQAGLARAFCELFARLHRLEWRALVEVHPPFDPTNPYGYIRQELGKDQQAIGRYHLGDFQPVLDWLSAHEVPAGRLCLLHNDFHGENILLREETGLPYVIDWPNWAIGDFRADLAWTLLLSPPETRPLILAGYEAASGQPVENLAYFEVLTCMRRLLDITLSLQLGAGERGMRPGAEDLMRARAGHIREVYTRLQSLTGLDLPTVEELLSGLA